MSQPTTIYLVRHGEAEHNRDGIISGQVDSVLTPKGRQQAQRTKQALSQVHFDEVYSSSLRRAVKTVEIITSRPLPAARQLVGLRERNFGAIDGKSEKHLDDMHQKRLAMPEAEGWHYKHVPDMESDHEIEERFARELLRIAKLHSGKTILIGSHGGLIRALVTKLQNKSYRDFPRKSFVTEITLSCRLMAKRW